MLEGGTTHRHVVYRRGYGCPCISGVDGVDREAQKAALEVATYRFLDHAMDIAALDPRAALRKLVTDPYPDQPSDGLTRAAAATAREAR